MLQSPSRTCATACCPTCTSSSGGEPNVGAAMASLAVPEKTADAVTRPPELSDAEYVRAVLQEPAARTEDEIEQELRAAAQELGIDIPDPSLATASSTACDKPDSPATDAATITRVRDHTRTHSRASSDGSGTTAVHSIASSPPQFTDTLPPEERTQPRRRSKGLSFSQYDKYLAHLSPNLTQPKFLPSSSSSSPPSSFSRSSETASIFGGPTRRSMTRLKRGLSQRLRHHLGRRQTAPAHLEHPVRSTSSSSTSCVCCREDFSRATASASLHTLPCGHTYCHSCLCVMISQSAADESRMPPRCCTQPVPSSTVRRVLPEAAQQSFLKAVLLYSTPWEARMFCPGPGCGAFIPPGAGRRRPFEVVCPACGTGVCVTCRRGGHRPGQDCPDDGELDAVLRMGERSGWRRCYKCRTLVELTHGCTHMTCRCRAQFCYICGAAWDSVVGCPNYCNGEEELERRRAEEEAREAQAEAEEKAREEAAAAEEKERIQADGRTAASEEVAALARRQGAQMEEFRRFERRTRGIMWTRHSQRRLAVTARHKDQMEKTRERHARTEQHLEDRQIEAEMELRSALEQSERSIRIQLKYMEAYCNGPQLPEREVTWKHREQLARQYHVRDGMERRHQSQINVLREKQAKRMEELVERHEKELAALAEKTAEEVEDLGLVFANEEEMLVRVFEERRERMVRRWALEGEVLRRKLERRDGLRYGPLPLPEWPAEADAEEAMSSLKEEESRGDVKTDGVEV